MSRADWAEFLRLIMQHALAPVAWRSLEAHKALLPELVATDLQTAYTANTRRNLWLAGELTATLRKLAATGITAAPWKGPVLAHRAYGDVSLRQFYDLDILVRRHELLAARDVMSDMGFRTEKRMSESEQEVYVDHQGELEMVRDSDGLWLELHSAVVPTYYSERRAAEHLWQRLTQVELMRTKIWALDPVDELEALCIHGSKHRWERVAWILDIALMVRLVDVGGWARLIEGSRARGSLRMVHLGLLLAAELCAADLPGAVARSAGQDGTARRLTESVKRDLFNPQPRRFDSLVFHARMRERSSDQIRYLLNVAFRPSGADWEALRLPRLLFPLYALTRPIRLARKYGNRLLSKPR